VNTPVTWGDVLWIATAVWIGWYGIPLLIIYWGDRDRRKKEKQ